MVCWRRNKAGNATRHMPPPSAAAAAGAAAAAARKQGTRSRTPDRLTGRESEWPVECFAQGCWLGRAGRRHSTRFAAARAPSVGTWAAPTASVSQRGPGWAFGRAVRLLRLLGALGRNLPSQSTPAHAGHGARVPDGHHACCAQAPEGLLRVWWPGACALLQGSGEREVVIRRSCSTGRCFDAIRLASASVYS